MQQNSVNFCSLTKFVNEKKLLHKERSGFRPSDSCECQQFSIVHGIYKLFDCNPPFEFTGIFLDISKALGGVREFRMMGSYIKLNHLKHQILQENLLKIS